MNEVKHKEIEKMDEVKPKKKKLKCSFCNKKVGLIPFPCDCGGVFCSNHRYTHTHDCPLKLKTQKMNKENIIKKNPKIDFKKVEAI
jgi:AN1-type zinc finger protein 5/6